MFNKKLHKQSCGRYELLKSKYYMIDYDETGRNRIIRKYNEIKEIIDCMNLESEIDYE